MSDDKTDATNPHKLKAFSADESTGELAEIDQEIVPNNPKKVSIHPSGRFVYLARSGGGDNIIELYAVNLSDGSLTPVDSTVGTGTSLADVKVSHDGRYLFAGYGSKVVESYSIDQETGRLTLVANRNASTSQTFPIAMFAHPTLPFIYASESRRGLHGFKYNNSDLTQVPGSPKGGCIFLRAPSCSPTTWRRPVTGSSSSLPTLPLWEGEW